MLKKLIPILLIFILSGCGPSEQSSNPNNYSPSPPVIQLDDDKEPAKETEQEANEESVTEPEPEQISQPASGPVQGELTVHYIDVGQGDAILIKLPSSNILIDGGNRGTTTLNYLRNQGVKTLDLVIGSHPHADHIGGLINVFESITVKEVIDPGVPYTTKTFEDYLLTIDRKNIKFTEGRAGMTRSLTDGATLKVLHPSSPSSNQVNDASVVTRLTFGEISFIFTGDAEQSSERQIINRGYDLKGTILKAGHHGSNTSTTQAFLNAVSPEVAIIMCGANNSYGHPHQETLKRLADAKVDVYRTDINGTIIVTTDGKTYSVNKSPVSYKEQPQPPPESQQGQSGEFVGSRNSDKYHLPDCRHANNISPNNIVSFKSTTEAKNAGYVPCKVCGQPN